MTRRRWLQLALGLSTLVAAIWLLATGSIWVGFWLLLLAVILLVREPIRLYWQRVAETDPGEPAPAPWLGALLRRLNVTDPSRSAELDEGFRTGSGDGPTFDRTRGGSRG